MTEKAALILTQRIMEMVPFMLWRKGKKKYELRILVLKNKKKPK